MSCVATMALLLSQNGLRSNLRASNFENFPTVKLSQAKMLMDHAEMCICVKYTLHLALYSQSFQKVIWVCYIIYMCVCMYA